MIDTRIREVDYSTCYPKLGAYYVSHDTDNTTNDMLMDSAFFGFIALLWDIGLGGG